MRSITRASRIGVRCGAVAVVVLLSMGNGVRSGEKAADGEASKPAPRIEVVFCLDTTGSMSGLIAGAKEKIWSIANTMAMAKPAPDIRMGLVGYRDRGDAYVTKITPLTDDLDKVYADLMGYQAKGGGDTPESVNQALHEAVHKIAWSKEKAYRVIFLVGDCPPHMDYQDDVKYADTCKQACVKGITINTVQCGGHGATVPIWQDIARRAEGQYFQVAQSGSALAVKTPFDAEIVKLNTKLEASRVYYGTVQARQKELGRMELSGKLNAGASKPAAARRALYNASKSGTKNFYGRQELIHDVERKAVEIADIPEEHLPPAMRKMTVAERTAFVEKTAAERKALQAQLAALGKKRTSHIDAQLKKMRAEAVDGSFSKKFHDAFRSKAADHGLEVPAEGPAH
ncbi:VWA domain-containing protein [bacterium]|nr:VWA domain-containing protein [bacterium]